MHEFLRSCAPSAMPQPALSQITILSNAGYDPYEKKLLGVTAMQKQLGKKRFEQLLSGLVIKPQGKPVLAPEDDRRPEFNTAINDFEEENENE